MTRRRFVARALLALSCMVPLVVAATAAEPGGDAPIGAGLGAPVGMRPWTGDFDGMVKRRVIRVLVPHSKTFYYVEKGRARGVSAEIIEALEAEINKDLKSRTLKVKVIALPVARDEMLPKLVAGYGDVVIADTSITPERQAKVDFAKPMFPGIPEVTVTGPNAPAIDRLDDLAGKEVYVRRDTSYWEHLTALNQRFAAEGKLPVTLRAAPDEFEAEDILEMVNAGLVPVTVMDRYKVRMWQPVMKSLSIRENARVAEGNAYAFMLRKDSPQWKAVLDRFVTGHARGTAFGNTIINRYVKDPKFVKNAAGAEEQRRFGEVVAFFRKYGQQYDLDYLLMMAQGFQESTLDQSVKSRVGAIGIMQVMPATAKDLAVGDVTQAEANVHAGVKYIRFMMDRYFKDEPMTPLNKGLFTFASYNAGPARIASLRKEAAKRGLDPNRWFHNVELVAADKIGPETVTYVANIYKYYTAYKLLEQQEAERAQARKELKR
ncbi:MAG: lytic transglycosylase F [Burkholderiales bacterium]